MDTNQLNEKDAATTECDDLKKFRTDIYGNRRTDEEAASAAFNSVKDCIALGSIAINSVVCGYATDGIADCAMHGVRSMLNDAFEDMYTALLVLDL